MKIRDYEYAALVVAWLLLSVCLSGCTNLKFQWAASYQTDNLAADLRQMREEPKPQPPISYRIGK